MIDAMPSIDKPAADAPNKWRIPAIDGLRAVAMLMVVSCHMYAFSYNPVFLVQARGLHLDVGRIFTQFPSGVDLFMVLSGFCLFMPLCKSPEAMQRWQWRSFYARRVQRIVPPYYAAIAYAVLLPVVLVAVFYALQLPAKWQPLDTLWVYVAHLLFLQTLFLSTFGHVNAAFWSLALEAQFYVVFPLVVFGFRRFSIRFLVAMIVVSIIYRMLAAHITMHMGYKPQYLSSIFFLGRWMQFAAGMAAAWFVANHRHKDQWRSAAWGTQVLVGSVALFIVACAFCPDLSWWRSLLLALAFSGTILAFCVSTTPLRALVENRLMAWLGFISYSIFLVHWPTVYYLSEILKKGAHLHGRGEFLVLCTLGFAIVVGVSYVFFLLFEKPFLNAPKQNAKRASKPDLVT